MTTWHRSAALLAALFFSFPAYSQPDLEGFSTPFGAGFGANPDSAPPGDTVVVFGWRVRNTGTNDAPASIASIHLSTDAVLTASDRQLGSVAIPAMSAGGGSGWQSIPVLIPDDVIPGDYHIGIIVDADNSVAESDENNNVLISNRLLTVLAPLDADLHLDPTPSYGPWLAIGDPDNRKLPARTAVIAPAGQLYVLYFEMINSGPEAVPAFNVAYYLSTDDTLSADDRRLGGMRVQNGAGGDAETVIRNRNPMMLPEQVPPGTYTVIVSIDDNNEVIEAHGDPVAAEANNTFSFSLNVLDIPADDIPLSRVQVRMTTDTKRNADSDESSFVAMNHDNQTWLDYCRNDFEKGDSFTYDLTLGNTHTLRDLDFLRVGKVGEDGWCVKGIELFLNDSDSAAYNVSFPSCRWIDADNDEDEKWEQLVGYDDLRNAASWNDANVAVPDIDSLLRTHRDKTESIIEATVGDAIHGNEAYWDRDQDGDCVSVARDDDDSLSVDLDLKADVPGWDPRIDIDFDIDAGCDCDVITLDVSNFEVDVDSRWYAELLSLGIYELVDQAIEAGIEDQMGVQLANMGQSLPTDLDFCPDIEITNAATIVVNPIIEQRPDPTVAATIDNAVIDDGASRRVHISVPNLGNVPEQFTTTVQFLFREGQDSGQILSTGEYDVLAGSTVTLSDNGTRRDSVRCAATETNWHETIQIPQDLQCTQVSRLPSRVTRPAPGMLRPFANIAHYHLITRIQPDNDVNDQNNMSVQLLNVRRPDLVAVPPEFSVSTGGAGEVTLNVNGRVENLGSAKSGPARFRIFVQRLNGAQRINGPWVDFAGLLPGTSYSWRTLDFALPSTVPPGRYAVGLEVTTQFDDQECDAANNLAVQRLPLVVD